MIRQLTVCAGISAGLLAAGCTMNDNYPAMTADGLPRVEDKRLDAVYWQPELDLSAYDKILIEECDVSFRKNWQRDQNTDRAPGAWVTEKDMDRIRNQLAERFSEIFVTELTEDGAFEVVSEAGLGVLRVRPKIVDLDVYAPDIFEPGIRRVIVTEAGRMTLELDLIDAATGEPVGRIVDRRRARYYSEGRVANSVTNRVEADAMLRRWALLLKSSLTASS